MKVRFHHHVPAATRQQVRIENVCSAQGTSVTSVRTVILDSVKCTENLLGSVDDNILDEYYSQEQEKEKSVEPESFRCGYCGTEINSEQLLEAHDSHTICPKCGKMLEESEVIGEDEDLLDSDEYESEEEDSSEEQDDY